MPRRPDFRRPDFDREGREWPNRGASRFVSAGGIRWHVQRLGRGPAVLLVHGTGAATHSWRDLAPLLAADFEVVAPDLPGHGFTESPGPAGLSLPGVAAALARLLETLGTEPALALGHSAGAAVLARLCLDGAIAPRALVSVNGALLPLTGLPAHWFAPAARAVSESALLPTLFAWRARFPGTIKRLLARTGSRIDARGAELYRRLATNAGHVAATVDMMSHWDLKPLERELPQLAVPLVLAAGERDATVRPSEAQRVHALLPCARIERLPGLGHLAHEERPELFAALLRALARTHGLAPARCEPAAPTCDGCA